MTPRTRTEQIEASEARESASGKEFVEYIGEKPFGTEFVDRRLITRKDAKDGWDISISKDLEWTKRRDGRMLLAAEDIPDEALAHLREAPDFKVVTE